MAIESQRLAFPQVHGQGGALFMRCDNSSDFYWAIDRSRLMDGPIIDIFSKPHKGANAYLIELM